LHAKSRSHFEEDHEPTGVIIGARRPGDCVVVGSDQKCGQFLSLSGPARILDRHHIVIGLAPGTHALAAGGPPGLGKLRCEIVRRLSKRTRTRLRMTLTDEGLKMAIDSEALGCHEKKSTG
jgi:hypothetical protein